MPDKIDQLFDDLQSRGYAKDKTRKQFRDYMLAPGKQGYENRRTFFEDFKSNGETSLGSYEDFKGLLGLHATKQQKQNAPSVYQKAQGGGGLGRGMRNVSAKVQQSRAVGQPQAKVEQAPQVQQNTQPWQQPWELDMSEKAVMPFQREDKRRAEAPISPQTGKAVPKKDPVREEIKDIDRAAKGDKEAAKRVGVTAAQERMRDEIEYYNATGAPLRSEINIPIYAPMVVRDENGNMILGEDGKPLVGLTTDENRVAQYQQQERAVERRKMREAVIDPEVNKIIGDLDTELEGESRNALISAIENKKWAEPGMMVSPEERKAYEISSPENLLKVLNERYGAKLDENGNSIGSATDFANSLIERNKELIERSAARLGMPVEDYVWREFIPNVSERLAQGFHDRMEDKYSVKDTADFLTRKMNNSIIGTLATMGYTTKMQRQLMQEEMEKSREGRGKYYNRGSFDEGIASGIGGAATELLGTTMMFAADAGPMKVGSAIGGYAAKQVGNAIAKLGGKSLGAVIANSGNQFLAANVGRATKYLGYGVSGAFGMAPFMGTAGAVQDISAGDGTLSSIGQAFLEGAWEGAKFGFATGVFGVGRGELGRNISSVGGKLGFGMGTFLAENQIFAGLDYIKDPENFNWAESSADAFYMQMASKLSTPTHARETLKRFSNLFKSGVPNMPIRLTDSDKESIQRAFGGRDFVEIASDINNIGRILEDKENIPWVTRQKVSGYTMKTFESSRPRTYNIEEVGNRLYERAKPAGEGRKGELIEVHDFKDEQERDMILQQIIDRRANDDMKADFSILAQKKNAAPTQEQIENARAEILADMQKRDPKYDASKLEEGGADYQAVIDRANDNNNQANILLETVANDYGKTTKEVYDAMCKKPVERTFEEQSMIEDLAARMHEAAYPEGEYHPSQSGIDAAEMVGDGPVIDPQVSAELSRRVDTATNEYNQFMQSHQNILEGVTKLGNVRPDEVLMFIADNYSGSERDEGMRVVSNYYNALAAKEAAMEKVADNIENYVTTEVDRRGFKGMLDGAPDVKDVITITDGEKNDEGQPRRLTLLNGEVGTKEDAASGSRMIDPEKSGGQIICRDENGEFVILKPDAKITFVEQVSKEDFANGLRQGLGVRNTQTVIETGLEKVPQEPTPAPSEEGKQQGGQPAVEAGRVQTGADEAAGETPIEQPTPAPPVEENRAVEVPTDDNGVKLYEQGTPIDDAIADMQKDGYDPVQYADLAISEAKEELGKMKEPKTRADLVRNNARSKELQNTIDYYNALKEKVTATASQQREQESVMGASESEENVNVSDEGNTVDEKELSLQEQIASGNFKGRTADDRRRSRIEALKEFYGDLFDADFSYAKTAMELASMAIGRKRMLSRESLEKELGYPLGLGTGESWAETLLAKKGEGKTVKELAHDAWEGPENPMIDGEHKFDVDEIYNAILDLFRSAGSKSDVIDYPINSREEAAKRTLEGQKREAEADDGTFVPLTAEEIEAIESNLPFAAPVEGEDIPDSPITLLSKAVAELQKQEGTPEIKLVDTDRMTDDEWYDIASDMFGGAFVSQEDINKVRDYVLETGVFYNPEKGITIFSGRQTEAEIKEKVQIIKDSINDRVQEKGRNDREDTIVQRHEEGTDGVEEEKTPADRADDSKGEGRTEPEQRVEGKEEKEKEKEKTPTPTRTEEQEKEPADKAATSSQQREQDEYLKPRNEKEKEIVNGVLEQLQQEIDAAVKERDKAASALEKARAEESDKATDLFSDDNAFKEEGQLFDSSDMPTDRSQEGVNKRTSAERERLNEAQEKLNKLQSEAERNSRIRGALDNERKQTRLADVEKEIDERHKGEYEQYIKPLLNKSDEELQQMAKAKEDAAGGNLSKLSFDKEYNAIRIVLTQRGYDRHLDDVKNFIENTIDDNDVTFVDKLSITEFDKLKRLIEEQGVDDPGGKIEKYVKSLRKKYPVEQTETPSGEAEGTGADKPLTSLAEVKQFMDEIGYKGSLSKVITDKNGKKAIRYQASGKVTPVIVLGETTKRDIYRQFRNYRNVMDVRIPSDIDAELSREDASLKEIKDALYASDRDEIKDILTEAGIPFADVIDSERGSRIVFTDKKNGNGNYTDWVDVSDPEQARENIDYIKSKAERYKADPMEAIEKGKFVPSEKTKELDKKAQVETDKQFDLEQQRDKLLEQRDELESSLKGKRGAKREEIETQLKEVRKQLDELYKKIDEQDDITNDAVEEWRESERKDIMEHFGKMTDEEILRLAKEKEKAAGGDEDELYSDPEYNALIDLMDERGIDDSATDPIKTIEKTATEFKKEQDKEIGITHDETPEQKADRENAEKFADTPITADEIDGANISDVEKTLAKAYLNGNQGFLQKAAYLKAYDNVRNRRQDGTGDSLDAESGTQLDSGENQREPGSGRVGESAVPMDEAKGGIADEGQTRLENGEGQSDTPVGERGDRGVSGAEPSVDGLPSGGERREGSRESGGTRRDVRGAESDKGGGKDTPKPAAGSDAAIAASKQRLAELRQRFKKASRNGMVNVSLVGMNSEQIEVLMDITTEAANLGYQYLAKGIREFKEWNKQMLDDFHDWLQEDMKWSDAEIDEYLNEVWNCEYNINGVTRSIREWASFLGEKELRKQVKSTLGDKFEAQKAAEGIEVKTGDIDNIRETLPFLLPEQQDDVLKAETQFFDESHQDREHGNGKGMMFTNGTGTGKTYTGLGIVKRFVKQGKGRVLILTPSQEKVTDWANDGLNLGLNVEKLDDIAKAKGTTATKSKGTGVVVTTYANARQNLALLEDCFDLIVYDESHKITEGKEAAEGEMYKFHQMLTNKDVEKSIDRQTYWLPEWIEYRNLVKEREENRKRLDILDNYSSDETVKVDGNEINVGELRSRLNARMLEIENRFGELQPIMQEIRESKRGQAEIDSKRTKTVFLSATPFNTRENMKYAEGYLFSYPEEDPSTVGSYNHRSPEDAFLERYFPAGYRWRYGRLESHVSNAEALGRQEIDFSDYLQNQLGTLSGRMISSDYDYSRDFPIMTLDHAGRFNQAMSEVYRNKRYNAMSEAFRKSFDYNYSTALFEAMKTSLVIDRIKEHLKRGQKIVVFHRRRTSGDLEPPFEKALNVARVMAEVEGQNGNQKGKQEILNAVKAFSEDFADMLEWEKGLDYTLPRDQIAKVFGEDKIGFFSGAENKKTKHGSVEDFMKDNGGKDIIIIQEASGKEGISLHDQTGEHQRVEINLALPQSPIAFIQIEGRIYRIGQKSNAIFEYPLLGLDLETDLFAQRFNSALGTTENLALGSKARNLRKSIANSILMNTGMVDYDRQGLGGKDMDGQVSSRTKDGFDDAINDYYGNQKMQRGRANREGYDYFPTPEPVGFKMVEWGQLMEGESALEPSAGHGAIARYVPETNSLTAIEPSADLFSKLQLRAGGPGRRFEEKTFEDYPLANKHDVIVMNPPYGTQGKMAMEHVEKAFKHLNEGGRLIAIIPDGPAMEKRFDAWLNSTGADRPNGSNVLVGEVKLPDVAFGRAGTNVRTRIVVIDKVSRPQMREGMPGRVSVDLSGAATVEDMFEELRHVNMPERTIDQAAIAQKQALKTRKSLEDNKFVRDVVIDEYGVRVGNRSSYGSVPGVRISFEQLDNPAHRRSLLQQVEGLIKARDNAENLDYGKWKNKTYGSGKNAVPAVEAIRDYCDTAIKTIANVLKTTPDGLEKEIKFMKEEEERQRQEREAERQRAIEQREREHEEKVKSVIETALKENGNNEKMTPQEIAENIRLAHGQSWSDARTASAKLRAAGIDWETGHQIVDKMKTLESSYNEQMPLSLETMKRLMVIADTAISAGSRMSAKRALEMSGIHSDTGEAKEGFDYSSHDEYYEKDLRGFLGQASPFSRLKTRIQEQEERKPAPAAPQPAKKESFEYKLDQNTKTGADMHLVVMNERVDDATYKDLQRKAKALNDGYYNRFKKAWHFKTEEDARKFMEQVNVSNGNDGRPTTRFRSREADEDGRFDFEKPISSKKLKEKGIAKDLRDIKANKWNLPERVRDVVAEKLEQYMSNKDGEIQDIDYSPYFGEKGETTAKSVLEHIGKNSTDKGVRELASYLLKNLGDNSNVPVRFSESRVGARGSYYTQDHSVVIRRGAARGADEATAKNNLEQTVIHEIAHAVTVKAIENSPEVRKEFLQIYKDYVELSEQYGINTGYAAKNPKEFVAEFLGRKAFREALMELRDGKKSFGQRVLDFIKEKIFHISPKDTFFNKADDAIKKVLDMANKGDYPYSDEVAEDATTRFRFAKDKEEFDKIREDAVRSKGLVVKGLNDADVTVTHVDNHDFGERPIGKARDWANKNLVTSEEDAKNDKLPKMKDGTPYMISKKAIGKYLSDDGIGGSENQEVHLSVLKKLKEVISESIEAEVHPDYPKVNGKRTTEKYNDNALIHRLYGAVEIGGKVYRVKTTMQEFRGSETNKPHSYEVTKIELLDSPMTASESPSVNVGRHEVDTKESTNNSISGAKLLKGVEKSYDSGKKLLDESEKSTFFRKGSADESSVNPAYERNRKAGERLAKKLNADFEAITDKSQIKNQDVLDAMARGEEPTGWIEIDKKTGKHKIYMYMPNIRDTYEAEKTIAHEVVGHHGLRELLGEEGYRSYMRTLWLDMKDESLSKYIKENYSRHGDIYTTIDEYLAEAAEKGYGKLPMWQKVRDVMTDALRKAGFEMTPSISDVKYMVWLSKHRLESGNPINAIERNALLHRLNMEKNEARVRNGEFSFGDEAPAVTRDYFPGDKTLFRSTPSAKTAKWLYEKALSRWGYSWKESHVDKMQAAVELMRAISGVKKIEDIPSVENFVLAENQMSSKEEQIDYLFNRDYMEPLTKAVAAVLPEFGGNTERALRNLQVYMVKKSGLERNRCLYVRDKIREYRKDADMDQNAVDQLEDDWNQLLDDIRDDIRKGAINLREYLKNMDSFIRQNIDANYKADDHDYSGLTAMTGSKKGYDDSMVIDDVMDDESMVGEEKIKTLWEKTKAVSQYGLDAEYEGGLDSKEKHDKVSKMFEWYVPMRGYDETRAEEVYDYLEENKGSEFVGPVLMNAKGRESLSNVDIFAQLGAMSCNAVHRALKNQMKQSFARFVRNHYDKDGKDRLVTELKYLWGEKRYDPDTGASYWEEVFPDIPENATADDVAKIVEDFEKDMKAKEAAGSAKRMRQNSSIPFRMSPKNKPQHIVEVYINGEKKTFIVNGNPRAAQAINGELNPETNHRVINRITRTMAQLNTSYNPDFVVGNTERDYIFSSAAILAKESPKYFAHWQKNYFGRGIARGVAGVPMMHTNLFKRYRQGNLDMSNPTDRYFKEFMENGGETGWVEQKNLEKWRKEIKKGVKTQGTAEKAGRFIINAIPEAIEAMNERAENAARFATYMTSRQMGRSITRSVSDAKEVSVNFNRKGAGLKAKDFAKNGSALRKMNAIAAARTAQYGQDYLMFYNAGVQGLNNAAKILRDHPMKASTIFAGFALGAFLMSNLNQALIDDEDPKDRGGIQNPYAELPEWIRRNRLCLYAGKGEFITVDLPIELRALYGIGDIAAAYTTHPELRSQKPVWQDVMTQITQILPVDFMGEHPGEPWMSFVPSFAMPFAEVAMNQNWYGRKIEKDQYVDENDPRWTRAYRNANRAYIDASKGLNAGTNRYSEEDLKKMGIKKEDVGNVDAQIKGAADGKITDPAIVEHIVNGYFGGAGQTAGRLAAIAKGALQGENIGDLAKSPQMPIVRRLHYSPTEQNKMARTRNKWWHYKDEMDEVMNEVKLFGQYGVEDPISKMKQISVEDSVRATRASLMKDAQKQYKALKRQHDKMEEGPEKEAVQMRMDQLMENTVMGLDSIR